MTFSYEEGAIFRTFKDNVRRQIDENEIKIYNFFPGGNGEAQEGLIPFAVVSSNTLTLNGDGKEVRGREYPWGTVNIEDKVNFIFILTND